MFIFLGGRGTRAPAASVGTPGSPTRLASCGAYALLGELLFQATGLPARYWRIGKNRCGKPHAVTQHINGHFDVSVSHSGRLIAAAVSTIGPIGIDVECRQPGRDVVGMAGLAFGESERLEVIRNGEDAFYRIWTLREAMAKALGVGYPLVVDGCDRVPLDPVNGSWGTLVDGRRWFFSHSRPDAMTHIALACLAPSQYVSSRPNCPPSFYI